jgi:hypothetical protein
MNSQLEYSPSRSTSYLMDSLNSLVTARRVDCHANWHYGKQGLFTSVIVCDRKAICDSL